MPHASEINSSNLLNRLTLTDLELYIRTINTAQYANRRNYIGGSTRLSEYISRGMISVPRVRELVLENNSLSGSYKFINELAWREYWHLVWTALGDGIFDYIRPMKVLPRPELPEAILLASTGITALDAGIKQLQKTGYIDNHTRLWLAGLICNVARCDWKVGAAWMHSYLIDGDYASNHLSWQWVAGSYTGKQYLPQQDNINVYTQTNQNDTYLDQPYESIASMQIPERLLETQSPLPKHEATDPDSTITVESIYAAKEVLLYSPWTLDPRWRQELSGLRVLLIDSHEFANGQFSQNVIDSIMWFAGQIPGLYILFDSPNVLASYTGKIVRKSYPGIADWPGAVDAPERMYPEVPVAFYPSFSAYWKQVQKYSMTSQRSLFEQNDIIG
jgi:deoxyribodipyrimidine photo-lyase